MSTVTKQIEISKLYTSDIDADTEARQFTTYTDMLDRMTPAPRTWKVQARILEARVFKAPSPRDRARVCLVVEAVGEPDNIQAWQDEYNRLHSVLATDPTANRKKLQQIANNDESSDTP